jgi:hypothetical protein
MAEIKKRQDTHQEGQIQHLEQINEHLRAYLVAQYKHQEELRHKLEKARGMEQGADPAPPPRPSPELSDYLLAHGLKEQYEARYGKWPDEAPDSAKAPDATDDGAARQELLAEGLQEVFGRRGSGGRSGHQFDINPLRIAYSKLPMALRNRKFGRPSLHAHSHAGDGDTDTREPEEELSGTAVMAEPQLG